MKLCITYVFIIVPIYFISHIKNEIYLSLVERYQSANNSDHKNILNLKKHHK